MKELLFHPVTQTQLDLFIKKPAHGLAIIGNHGSGKLTTAFQISAQLLKSKDANMHPYFKIFAPVEKDSITIDQVREIVSLTKLKTIGDDSIRRIILIDQADKLTIEAQNALLKVIEEPPRDTVLILNITNIRSILPTLISRIAKINIHAPTQNQSFEYLSNTQHSKDEIAKAYTISNGYMGLMSAILDDDIEHPLLQHIEQAKAILRSDTFQRLMMIDQIVKAKTVSELLYGLQQTAQSALVAASQTSSSAVVSRWSTVLLHVYNAREQLNQNTQTKLVLTNLMLHI